MNINFRERYENNNIEYICHAHWTVKCDLKYLKKDKSYTYCSSKNTKCKHQIQGEVK
jgi:hypothetical protein